MIRVAADFEQFCVTAISHLMEGDGELGTTIKACPVSCLREIGTKLIIIGSCLDLYSHHFQMQILMPFLRWASTIK